MSPLWFDTIKILIDPMQLTAIRRHGWLKPRITRYVQEFNSETDLDTRRYQHALESILNQAKPSRNAKLEIIVSSNLIRYMTLPALQTRLSASEKIGYAKAAFRETYGQGVSEWEFQVDSSEPGKPSIAVAIDASLLEQIQSTSKKLNLRLCSVSPYFMAVFNRYLTTLSSFSGLLVIVEQQRSLLAHLHQGECFHLKNVKLNTSQESLYENIQREALMHPELERALAFFCPELKHGKFDIPGWKVLNLPHKQSATTKKIHSFLEDLI